MRSSHTSFLDHLINFWRSEDESTPNFAFKYTAPASLPAYVPFPDSLNPIVQKALHLSGIDLLYTHQLKSWNIVNAGGNLAVVTGTASGKTLCYNLPILDALLQDNQSCALFIFPTKALAQDQFHNLISLIQNINLFTPGANLPLAIYDGDTPSHSRSKVRSSSRLVLTNPDMLHMGILPHHTIWSRFLENLRFIVLDEMHVYRGVFGSNIANVIRRLKRILHFYGADPQFILTSATIANPKQLAERLIEAPVSLVDEDGSPHGERHFWIYNPPIVNDALGIRQGASISAELLASDLLHYHIQTLIFARTRRSVELLLRSIKENNPAHADKIYGYRSGYLSGERRSIEHGLRNGLVQLAISTNALELGVDIGEMEAVLMIGYPGTIAATRQQSGRAGRGTDPSISILIASASPLDQFLVNHPEFILEKTPELALINPDNLLILLKHLECAAFELPFSLNEGFGNVNADDIQTLLDILSETGKLHTSGQKHYWISSQYPADSISLRQTTSSSIILRSQRTAASKIIGEVDEASSLWMVHQDAIYLHEGETYLVDALDLEKHEALMHAVSVDYFTEPINEISVDPINTIEHRDVPGGTIYFGDIMVTNQVVGFKKVLWSTREVIGREELTLPPTQLRTTGYWLALSQDTVENLQSIGMWTNSPNNYGPSWPQQRNLARKRDQYRCQHCGIAERDKTHHVHHKTPFRNFASHEDANQLNNLVTLCPACHKIAETAVKMKSGLSGVRHVLRYIAPLFVMSDINDLGALSDPASPLSNGKPIILLYDQIPAGIGLSRSLFELHDDLILDAYDLVFNCSCKDGCPGCVGPAGENGTGGKQESLALLQLLCVEKNIGL